MARGEGAELVRQGIVPGDFAPLRAELQAVLGQGPSGRQEPPAAEDILSHLTSDEAEAQQTAPPDGSSSADGLLNLQNSQPIDLDEPARSPWGTQQAVQQLQCMQHMGPLTQLLQSPLRPLPSLGPEAQGDASVEPAVEVQELVVAPIVQGEAGVEPRVGAQVQAQEPPVAPQVQGEAGVEARAETHGRPRRKRAGMAPARFE